MTKHDQRKKQLESAGVEVTLKMQKLNGQFSNTIIHRAELYWRGKTGMGFDIHSYLKALGKAQQMLSRKFQPQDRRPIIIGLPGAGIAVSKRRL